MGRHTVIDNQASVSPVPDEEGNGLSRGSANWLITVFLGIVMAAVMSLIHLPYAIIKPGPVTNTLSNGPGGKPLITVQGTRTYPTAGALDFTTVAVVGGPRNPVNVWSWIGGHLDKTNEVVPEKDLFPKGVTPKEVDELGAAEMADSQQEAIAVALRGLGQKVPEVVTVNALTKGSPARGVLRPGDVLLSIDGKVVSTSAAVISAVVAHKPGESVAFGVRRDNTERVLAVKAVSSKGRTVVGVFLRTAFRFPIKVSINAGEVGGPSAGMMFSLAVYDKLSPGALTGGAIIAGTGTINSAGNVGPIGGIHQKMVGAKRGGAGWFLAPAHNCEEVVGHIPKGLRVVKVSTFTKAREAVQAIAAKRTGSLPQCT